MKLQHYLKQFDRLAIALSGGADSACLLREAAAALGPNRVLAVTVQTECTPQRRLRMAKRIAALADVEHVIMQAEVLSDKSILENGPRRAYFYQRTLLHAVLDEAWIRGCEQTADGMHADEAGRMEREAGEELHIISPFIACGMGAWQVAALRKGMAEDAAQGGGCLADRIPAGTPLTLDALTRIDEAEEALLRLGYPAARVRLDTDAALVYAPEGEYSSLAARWNDAEAELQKAGFDTVRLLAPV